MSLVKLQLTEHQQEAIAGALYRVREALWFLMDVVYEAERVTSDAPLDSTLVAFMQDMATVLIEPIEAEMEGVTQADRTEKVGAKMAASRLDRLKAALSTLMEIVAELDGMPEIIEAARPAGMALRVARIARVLLGKGLPLLKDTYDTGA